MCSVWRRCEGDAAQQGAGAVAPILGVTLSQRRAAQRRRWAGYLLAPTNGRIRRTDVKADGAIADRIETGSHLMKGTRISCYLLAALCLAVAAPLVILGQGIEPDDEVGRPL